MLHPINRRKSNGECVGGIIGVDFLRDMHHALDHFYDLLLVSAAIACQLLLHLQRRHRDDGDILTVAGSRRAPAPP